MSSIPFLRPDVALTNATFEVSVMQSPDGKVMPLRKGLSTNVMVKQSNKWLVAALRGTALYLHPGPAVRRVTRGDSGGHGQPRPPACLRVRSDFPKQISLYPIIRWAC